MRLRGKSFKRVGDMTGKLFNRDLAERDERESEWSGWDNDVVDLWADWYANPEREQN